MSEQIKIMFKKIILSGLAIFTMCSTVIPAFADDNIPTGIDINGIPPIPHRAPKKPVSPLSTYLNVSTNSFFIVFNKEISNVTIKMYFEGMLVEDNSYSSFNAGQYEIIGLDFGEGLYTIEVTSNGNSLFYNTIYYTGNN
jgi:hypothetical protein